MKVEPHAPVSVPRRLVLHDVLALRAVRAAIDAAPREACGVLLGRRRGGLLRVSDLVVLSNRARGGPGTANGRFEILAADVARFLPARAAHDRALAPPALVGFWHSHPGAEAILSARDRRGAWPGYAHLVVGWPAGPAAGRAAEHGHELRASWHAAGRFHELEIAVRARSSRAASESLVQARSPRAAANEAATNEAATNGAATNRAGTAP